MELLTYVTNDRNSDRNTISLCAADSLIQQIKMCDCVVCVMHTHSETDTKVFKQSNTICGLNYLVILCVKGSQKVSGHGSEGKTQ